ncbi:glycosyltransferase family 4 protein [Azospirillum tabaci]|uniref:glycosyltransferase family 4 protein n=1 Tax=Azospirillum tabaci TaxID=2752310 RepID=UPI001660B51B|nr:glycosyltransferase family 4 protein [Azospirillum tabaci]
MTVATTTIEFGTNIPDEAELKRWVGSFDPVDRNLIRGWLIDQDAPARSAAVEICIDGVSVATVMANLPRPDVAASTGYDNKGFRFHIPAAFADGNPHMVTVFVAGTDLHLTGSPREVVVAPPAMQADERGPVVDKDRIFQDIAQPLATNLTYKVGGFNEKEYTRRYPDVKAAIRGGVFASGYQHWLQYGAKESRIVSNDAPLSIPQPLVAEQLLFIDAVCTAKMGLASSAFDEWRLNQLTDFPQIDELLNLPRLRSYIEEIEDPEDVRAELPVDFFVLLYYRRVFEELTGCSIKESIRQYQILSETAARYYAVRKDFWAEQVCGWSRLRAAQLLRANGRSDEARAVLTGIRRDHWDLGFKYKDRPLPRPRPNVIVFERATYELGMLDLAEGRLVDATIHATSLANETFGWKRDGLRRRIVPLIEQGLDRLKDGDQEEAARCIGDAYALFWQDPGRRMGRNPKSLEDQRLEGTKGAKTYDVVFYIGDATSESKRYRVLNLMDTLIGLGYRVGCFTEPEFPTVISEGNRIRCMVIFRSAYTSTLCNVVETFRSQGTQFLYDIDDLFFVPKVLPMIAGAALMSPEAFAGTAQCIEHFRQALMLTDGATGSTSFLVEELAALGRPARVVPNTFGPLQEKLASVLLQEPAPARSEVRIAYLSGSWTHHLDFAQCEQALRTIMARHPNVTLMAVGRIDLGPEWEEFKDRIVPVGFMSHQEMLAFYREIDISIAPLEVGNPYCEAKSQLKVFEAGLFGVPSIASATRSFREAVTDGVDGFLATTPEEWLERLERLVADGDLRAAMGQRARKRALTQFSEPALKQAIAGLFPKAASSDAAGAMVPARFGLPLNERKMRIVWVVPDIHAGSGGQRNILRFAYYLTTFGHTVSIVVKDSSRPAVETHRLINDHFYPFKGSVQNYNGSMPPCDILFATHWTTVEIVVRHRTAAKQACYFVQDFEPGFVPLGSEYLMAENTYRKGLYHITSGPYCERILKQTYSNDADHFKFPLDRLNYWQRPRTETSAEGTILYFARPEMPRRCFEFGNMMLAEVKMRRPGVQILMYGSHHVDTGSLPFEARNLGILPTIDDLARLYSNADLGIVFSLTNPSLVPYEMMACGLPVVDVRFQDNITNYGGREDIALLGDPDPTAFANQVIALLDDPAARAERVRKGKEFILDFPSEVEAVRRVEGLLLKRLDLIDAQAVTA